MFGTVAVATVVLASPHPQKPPVPAATLQWIQRRIASQELPNGRFPMAFSRETLAAVRHVERKYAASPEITAARMHLLTSLGRYDDAVQAATAFSKTPSVRAELSRAQVRRDVKAKISILLPEGRIQRVEPLGAHRWAVFSAKLLADPQWTDTYRAMEVLVVDLQTSAKLRWRSARLSNENERDAEASDIQLWVRDLTGDGRKEICIEQVFYGASWHPSQIQIWQEHGSGWRMIADVPSDEPLSIEDANADGHLEITNTRAIGWSLSHAEQPRWRDVYAWNGRRFARSDHGCGAFFAPMLPTLESALERHPGDWSLLLHSGRTLAAQGRLLEADQTLARAESSIRKEIAEERKDRQDLYNALGHLWDRYQEIRARRRDLRAARHERAALRQR